MDIETVRNEALSENGYFLYDAGEAVVIDPMRDISPYLEKLAATNTRLKYVLMTHFHADFISGHQELAAKTGATIVFGPTAKPLYRAHIAKDNDLLHVGESTIKVLHTPGHSLESTSFLVSNASGKDIAIFTGDTLFVGEIGRPDILQQLKSEITPEFLAGLLYDSLRNKILPLSDDIIIYPAHGAGSDCGKNIGNCPVDTIGHQKKVNYALNPQLQRDRFIAIATEGLPVPPAYYPFNVLLNQSACTTTQEEMMRNGLHPLTVNAFEKAREENAALIIDTRAVSAFSTAFIPGAVYIALDDQFSKLTGALITDLQQPILLVLDEGTEQDVISRLVNIGYNNTIGYLQGGIEAWIKAEKPVAALLHIEAYDFENNYHQQQGICLMDVRKTCEYNSQHIIGSKHFPLGEIYKWSKTLNPDNTIHLLCSSGNRSATAASILAAGGFGNVLNITGGIQALLNTDLPRSAYQEPVSQL